MKINGKRTDHKNYIRGDTMNLQVLVVMALSAGVLCAGCTQSDIPLYGMESSVITKDVIISSADGGGIYGTSWRVVDSDGELYLIPRESVDLYHFAWTRTGYPVTITYKEYFNTFGIRTKEIADIELTGEPIVGECCRMCCCQDNKSLGMCTT